MSVVPEAEREAHLAAVNSRHDTGDAKFQARAAAVAARVPADSRSRLLQQGIDARTVAQRIFWLQREAELIQSAASSSVACGAGCSHCCHISVLVAEPEAKEIGKALGRKPSDVLPGRSFTGADVASRDDGHKERATAIRDAVGAEVFGVPCTFLVDAKCSIYEHRPLACRHLFNVDVDSLLCQLVPGVAIEVPYLGMQGEQVAYVSAMGANARLADIRDWFPAG